MRSVELALAQLHSLPPASQAQALDYIEALHTATRAERLAALRQTAGCLSLEEADLMEEAIEQSCEQVDER